MPVTPQITVAGKLVDLSGSAEPGSLLVQLCGYGSQVPRISGTAMIAETAPLSFEADAGSVPGDYSFLLWGNDVITPGPDVTFYTITIVDANGNLVQVNAYQWDGTQSVDLATATPYIPVPPAIAQGLQYLPCTPAAPQAANTTYTAPGVVIMVFYNGAAQRPTLDPMVPKDYTRLSQTTFELLYAIYSGDTIYALCVV